MGNLYTRVSEIMDKIYEDSVFSVDREEQLAKLLKESFEDCYKKAANELDNPEEEIPSPGQIVSYIEQLPEDEYSDWIVEMIDVGKKHTDNKFENGLFKVSR